MRRRTPLNVWPSIADLMTVLAVPAVISAVGIYPFLANLGGFGPRPPRPVTTLSPPFVEALEQADKEMDSLAKRLGLKVDKGQGIRFGSDLVRFPVNSAEFVLDKDKEDAFRERCRALSSWYQERDQRARDIVIWVEGHTDSKTCREKKGDWCNWYYSAMRAVKFIDLMMDRQRCLDGVTLPLRGSAMASQRLAMEGSGGVDEDGSRRIELRIAPDYEALVKAQNEQAVQTQSAPPPN